MALSQAVLSLLDANGGVVSSALVSQFYSVDLQYAVLNTAVNAAATTASLIVVDTDADAVTITLRAAADVPGAVYAINNDGTSGNDVTVVASDGSTIGNDASQAVPDEETMVVASNGSEWVVI